MGMFRPARLSVGASSGGENAKSASLFVALCLTVGTALLAAFRFPGEWVTAAGLGLFCGAAFLIPRFSGLGSSKRGMVLLAAAALAATVLRGALFDYLSGDYEIAYKQWITDFRAAGGLRGLRGNIGDYSYAYRFLLALICCLPGRDVYLLKLLAIPGDLLVAYYGMRITGVFRKDAAHRTAAWMILLFVPTVVLNGAKWGQCDGLYSALMLAALYYGLDRKPWRSVIFGGLAFAMKLQAIFLVPIFAVLLLGGRIKLRHVPLFPAAYLAANLPALIAGHSLYDIVFVYFNQTGMFAGYLCLNAPSVFMLIGNRVTDKAFASTLGTAAAFLWLLLLLAHALVRRKTLTDRHLCRYALAMCVCIPFLLPSMHERYFYMAETLSVACACAGVCGELMPLLIQLPPLCCYDAYFRGHYRVYPELISPTMLICALLVSIDAFFDVPSLRVSLEAPAVQELSEPPIPTEEEGESDS